jgi:hypothetical protein
VQRLRRAARAVASVVLTVTIVPSCGEPTATAAVRSGISGKVVAGPTCPVETPESPCPDRPVPDALVTAKARGTSRSTRTDASGSFRLRLKPDTYSVTASSDQVFGCDEQRVRVVKRRFTDVTVTCDTGIR